MDYKNCEYFKESEEKGHCPFSSVCKDDCYFSLVDIKESYEELHEDYKALERENWELEGKLEEQEGWEQEYSDTYSELEDLKEEHSKLKKKFLMLVDYCKGLIVDLEKYEKVDKDFIECDIIEDECNHE